MEPRVSFVVTNYNYGRYIAHALDSLLSQTFDALEIIVVDDKSTDNSAEVLAGYADNPRVRIVRHTENQGSIRSYNQGLHMARGEFVGVFDADDYAVDPDAVARQVAVFDADPTVGFVYSAFDLVDEYDTQFRRCQEADTDGIRPGLEQLAQLLTLNTVPHSGTLVRRTCHDVVGYYDERLPYAGDWDLWLRLAGRFNVGYLAEPLYAYRVHRNNMTSKGKKPGEHTRERLMAVENAFAALPDGTPEAVRSLKPYAVRTALMCGTWNDRSFGRIRRSWEGLIDAVRRSPSLLVTSEPYAAGAKLLVLGLVGHARYERLAGWRASI